MAYIGREPQVGNFQVCDAISVVNGQAAYTMQVSSTNVSPETANHMLVSLNGVLQAPGSSYTVSGSTITFASNLVTGDVINFIHILGSVLDLGVPSNDTVGAAQIKDDLISGTTALASEPADTDEFLVSDAGVLKRIDYSLIKGGGITSACQFRLTADKTGNADITSSFEVVDTDGYGGIGSAVTESSGIFTFPLTGIYLIHLQATIGLSQSGDAAANLSLRTTTDNSSYNNATTATAGELAANGSPQMSVYGQFMFDVTSTSTHKVKLTTSNFETGGSPATTLKGDTASNVTSLTFLRLGDT